MLKMYIKNIYLIGKIDKLPAITNLWKEKTF